MILCFLDLSIPSSMMQIREVTWSLEIAEVNFMGLQVKLYVTVTKVQVLD